MNPTDGHAEQRGVQDGGVVVLHEGQNGDLGSWQTLQRFFRLCAQAGPQHCAFAAGGDPQRKYAELAARLRTTPLMIPFPGQPSVPLDYSLLVSLQRGQGFAAAAEQHAAYR
jgi:hypothetical protein